MSTGDNLFVVDDHPSVRKALCRLLTAAGYHVEAYASCTEFLASGHACDEGCLVLDIMMTGMNGFALQEQLVAEGSPLAVIFITGHGDEHVLARAARAGVAGILQKPFEGQLLETIEAALNH